MTELSSATESDLLTIANQLGRVPRDVVGIAARCSCGSPTVVSTQPRLEDGTPFPTFYYLTHPAATAALSALEADGFMVNLNHRIETDPEFAAAYQRAHQSYIHDREAHGTVPELDGVSAGGMPTRVKCLHAVAAHALAAGPGVNPAGDLALQHSRWSPQRCECRTFSTPAQVDQHA